MNFAKWQFTDNSQPNNTSVKVHHTPGDARHGNIISHDGVEEENRWQTSNSSGLRNSKSDAVKAKAAEYAANPDVSQFPASEHAGNRQAGTENARSYRVAKPPGGGSSLVLG